MSIITTNGKVEKNKLGITLPHEHLFCDLSFTFKLPKSKKEKKFAKEKLSIKNLHLVENNPGVIRDNLFLDNADMAKEEVFYFKLAGGNTIVEQSSIGAGRNVKFTHKIARSLGINIVVGTGYYLKESLPSEIVKLREKELFSKIMREAQNGIVEGIKPGLIGELGLGPKIGEWEKKLLKAVAKVQKEKGLAISAHIQAVPMVSGFSGHQNGLEALDILEKEGADLEKVVICHTDAKINLKYIREIIKRGAYAEFDHFGKNFYFIEIDFQMDRDIDRVIAIKKLIDDGYINKILISQDICLKTDLLNYGGAGYSHILNNIVQIMLKKGINQEEINTIMIDNPAELLNIESKYL